MSISDVEVNRERQQKKLADRREKEAAVRPDALHRAVLFLLKECAQNNPDAKHEVEFLAHEVDQQMKTGPDEADDEPGKDDPAASPDGEHKVPVSKRFRKS